MLLVSHIDLFRKLSLHVLVKYQISWDYLSLLNAASMAFLLNTLLTCSCRTPMRVLSCLRHAEKYYPPRVSSLLAVTVARSELHNSELKPENGSAENKWMYVSECWPRNVTFVYTKEDQEINLCNSPLDFFHFIQYAVSCEKISEFQNILQIPFISVILTTVVEIHMTLGKHLIIFLLPLYHYFSLPCPKICAQFVIFCCL